MMLCLPVSNLNNLAYVLALTKSKTFSPDERHRKIWSIGRLLLYSNYNSWRLMIALKMTINCLQKYFKLLLVNWPNLAKPQSTVTAIRYPYGERILKYKTSCVKLILENHLRLIYFLSIICNFLNLIFNRRFYRNIYRCRHFH